MAIESKMDLMKPTRNPGKHLGNHRGNMKESWGTHRGIVWEIGETFKETKVFCNNRLSRESP